MAVVTQRYLGAHSRYRSPATRPSPHRPHEAAHAALIRLLPRGLIVRQRLPHPHAWPRRRAITPGRAREAHVHLSHARRVHELAHVILTHAPTRHDRQPRSRLPDE